MEKLFFFFLCAFFSSLVSAQNVEATLGAEYEYYKVDEVIQERFLGFDETGYYYLIQDFTSKTFHRTAVPLLTKFNKKLELEYSRPLDFQANKYRVIDAKVINNNLCFFIYNYDNQGKVECVFINKSAKFIKGVDLFSMEASWHSHEMADIKFSADSSKILFLSHEKRYPISGKQNFYLAVFDSRLNKIFDANCAMPYDMEFTSFSDYEVSNQGEAFVMCTIDVHTEKKKAENGKNGSGYLNILYRFSKDSKVPKEIPLEESHPAYGKIELEMDPTGANLNILRFYKAKKDGTIDGVDYLRFNLVENKTTISTTKDFTSLNLSGKNIKDMEKGKGDEEFKEIDIKKIIPQKDGGYIVLAEHYYSYFLSFIPYNNRLNLILFKIDATGEFQWLNVVPKRQRQSHHSFAVMERENGIYLFYNENEKNMAYDLSENHKDTKTSDFKSLVVAMLKITPDGKITRSTAYKSGKEGVFFIAEQCVKLNDSELFITTSYGTIKVGKFKIRD